MLAVFNSKLQIHISQLIQNVINQNKDHCNQCTFANEKQVLIFRLNKSLESWRRQSQEFVEVLEKVGLAKNFNVCVHHWSIEMVLSFSTTTPGLTSPDPSKVERIGLRNSSSSTILARSLAHRLPLFQTSRQLLA